MSELAIDTDVCGFRLPGEVIVCGDAPGHDRPHFWVELNTDLARTRREGNRVIVTVTRDDIEAALRLVAMGNHDEPLTYRQWAEALFDALDGSVHTRILAPMVAQPDSAERD